VGRNDVHSLEHILAQTHEVPEGALGDGDKEGAFDSAVTLELAVQTRRRVSSSLLLRGGARSHRQIRFNQLSLAARGSHMRAAPILRHRKRRPVCAEYP